MITAAMIAMFYLGATSGVIGAVLVIGSSRSREESPTAALDSVLRVDELPHAA
jgi:hypothetical protein